MSGIIYEEDEDTVDTEAGSDVHDVAELERILEESEQESQHEDNGSGKKHPFQREKMERPKSALSVLQRHVECGYHQKKTIHWQDEQHEPPPVQSPQRPAAAPQHAPAPASASVSSFRRSLKLLRLQPHEFGMQDERDDGQQSALRKRPPRALVSTRLRERSVSLDDLRAAARDGRLTPDVLRDGDVYKLISSAVYEEWYFRKQREELERKRRQRDEERRQHAELEKKQADIMRRSQEKFEEWLQRKTEELRKNKQKGSEAEAAVDRGRLKALRAVPGPGQAERAFQEWKRSKDELRAASDTERGKLPGKQAAPDPQARREDAQKAYQMWKERVEKVQKQEAATKKRKEDDLLAATRKKEEEKKETSRKCFEHWKTVKDEQQRKAEEETRRSKARTEALEAERREQRQYEAQQAFLAWLDQVDERQAQAQAQDRAPASPRTALFSFRPARRHSCFT